MVLLISDEQLENIADIGNQIEAIATEKKIEYVDACILYCNRHQIEVETLGNLLKKHQKIVSKIRKEAEDLNYLANQKSVRIDFE